MTAPTPAPLHLIQIAACAYYHANGLAVTKALGRSGYAVVHVPSGLQMSETWAEDEDLAVEIAMSLAGLADWEGRSGQELYEDNELRSSVEKMIRHKKEEWFR